jgi:Rieske Fe-S protein
LHINILNRKDFILKTCAFCIAGSSLYFLNSCKTKLSTSKVKLFEGKIKVSKEDLFAKKKLILEAEELPYPIFISLNSKNEVHSFYMKCTHRDYRVVFKNNEFYCNNHGSRFDLLGKLIEGPANSNLLELPIKIMNDSFSIDITKVEF